MQVTDDVTEEASGWVLVVSAYDGDEEPDNAIVVEADPVARTYKQAVMTAAAVPFPLCPGSGSSTEAVGTG